MSENALDSDYDPLDDFGPLPYRGKEDAGAEDRDQSDQDLKSEKKGENPSSHARPFENRWAIQKHSSSYSESTFE